MIEVKIPKDVREYKGKLFLGFTVRKTFSAVGGIVSGGLIYFFGSKFIPDDILLWIVIVAAGVFFAFGFFEPGGMKFEEFAAAFFNFYFRPQKRVYEDAEVNFFVGVNEKLRQKALARQRVEIGETEETDTDGDVDIFYEAAEEKKGEIDV